MSIIYEALKRIEDKKTKDAKNNHPAPKQNNPKFPRIVYIICTLIIVGFLALFVVKLSKGRSLVEKITASSLPAFKKPSVSKKKLPVLIKPMPVTGEKVSSLAKDLPPLSLTGIFFSDGEYMALINDEMVRAGDFIEDVKIGKIDSGGVEIKFKGSTFRLSYP